VQNQGAMHVRDPEAHGHKLKEKVSGVDDQGFDSLLLQLSRQVAQTRFEKAGWQCPERILHQIFSTQLRDRGSGFGDGTHRYSSSQKGTKSRLAPRTMGPLSGTPINTTSFPRDCSLRASAVMGFRWPVTGKLTKSIFIFALLLVNWRGRCALLGAPLATQSGKHVRENELCL
jgi:hypothetical protein